MILRLVAASFQEEPEKLKFIYQRLAVSADDFRRFIGTEIGHSESALSTTVVNVHVSFAEILTLLERLLEYAFVEIRGEVVAAAEDEEGDPEKSTNAAELMQPLLRLGARCGNNVGPGKQISILNDLKALFDDSPHIKSSSVNNSVVEEKSPTNNLSKKMKSMSFADRVAECSPFLREFRRHMVNLAIVPTICFTWRKLSVAPWINLDVAQRSSDNEKKQQNLLLRHFLVFSSGLNVDMTHRPDSGRPRDFVTPMWLLLGVQPLQGYQQISIRPCLGVKDNNRGSNDNMKTESSFLAALRLKRRRAKRRASALLSISLFLRVKFSSVIDLVRFR